MILHRKNQTGKRSVLIFGLLFLVFLSACNIEPDSAIAEFPSPEPALVSPTLPPPTVTASPTATRLPSATQVPTRPSATPTPEPLQVFQSNLLYDNVQAVEYLHDSCQYLQNRWDPANAKPGTVVVPVMYHGVRKEGGTVKDNITVTAKYFKETMAHAKELGFETITMEQLENFLQQNAYIPPRSLLLIIDDRRLGTVRDHFLPILEENDWTLTMAYITGVINQQEWQQVKDVLATGHVEIQAHGFLHNGETYFTEFTPDEIIEKEVNGPIDAFKSNLGYRPTAFIWPGGNFTDKAVRAVREADYQVGFTAYARGPLMFNWIPLGEPERAMGEPLLMLPRYWSTAAYKNLDGAVEISRAAEAFAEGQRLNELEWYRLNCSDFPPIPRPTEDVFCEVCSQ